jgi:hypothetical protein
LKTQMLRKHIPSHYWGAAKLGFLYQGRIGQRLGDICDALFVRWRNHYTDIQTQVATGSSIVITTSGIAGLARWHLRTRLGVVAISAQL